MDNEIMDRLSALMMWAGLLMMLLGILVLLITWIQIQYMMGSFGGLLVGGLIALAGGILWLVGASRGKN